MNGNHSVFLLNTVSGPLHDLETMGESKIGVSFPIPVAGKGRQSSQTLKLPGEPGLLLQCPSDGNFPGDPHRDSQSDSAVGVNPKTHGSPGSALQRDGDLMLIKLNGEGFQEVSLSAHGTIIGD